MTKKVEKDKKERRPKAMRQGIWKKKEEKKKSREVISVQELLIHDM